MEARDSKFEIGALLAETISLLVSNWWRVTLTVAVLTGIGTWMDLRGDLRSSNILFTFVAMGFQIWITDSVLTRTATKQPDVRSGRGFGVILVSQLGILLGLILLIIPGVIVFVRWSMALPIALSSGAGVTDSMKRSWQRSEGHFWPIFCLLMLVYVPVLGAVVVAGVLAEQAPVLSSIVMNAILTLGLAAGWFASLATFLAGEPRTAVLQEVFA